ncbi:MAG: hypothetical protein Kow00127_12440 [Bacteroidales bacterium]
MRQLIILLLAGFCLFSVQQSAAQGILRKLKEKAEDKAVNAIFGEDQKTQEQEPNDEHRSSGISNTRGGGLEAEEIDVLSSIRSASDANDKGDFAQSRSSIRDALRGIEIELGRQVLSELPEEIEDLKSLKEEDAVASTQMGLTGLMISRTYRSSDREMNVIIGNDAAVMSAANLYMATGMNYNSLEENPDAKKITFQGRKGVIGYDESAGYSLAVPFGQSSVLMIEGVNFESEASFMSAADEIPLEKIVSKLGEN